MQFDLNEPKGVLGIFGLGGALSSYMAFTYYSMMEPNLEHTIAAFVFAIIGGLFLIGGCILLVMNSQMMTKANNVRNPKASADKIVQLLIAGTACLIALFVVLSQVIET